MSNGKDCLPEVALATLLSPDPRVGYGCREKVPLTTNGGRTLCCLAQRGECRYNGRHYGSGSSSEEFWSLPQIEPGCDLRCPYRAEVADPEVDTKYHVVPSWRDPYGYKHYKIPSDACRYRKPDGEVYAHFDRTCPQCSQPQVQPSDDWVDIFLVERHVQDQRMMHKGPQMRGGEAFDPVEDMLLTRGTKEAIRARLSEQRDDVEE